MKSFAEFRKSLSAVSQMLLVCLLVGLLVVFVVVMRSENPRWIFDLLGLSRIGGPETVAGNSKYEVLKFIGISMGGVLIALQAVIANKRAKAMDKTAQAQAAAAKAQARASEEQAKANWHTEQGQRQERLKNAIEHLGHESDSVRMGGAYELFHLARDTQGQDAEELRQTVLDILCAHIRWTTGKCKYRKMHKWSPSEEVQSLLRLLFVQQHEVFNGLRINLQGSWLNGARLQKARLEKAVLTGVYLQKAYLREAKLQEAYLREACLQRAYFGGGQLQGAVLGGAHLQHAYLEEAHLQGAYFVRADLQVANLGAAHLQGADLQRACLQGAYLAEAYLQGAYLYEAGLQGVCLGWAQLQGAELSGADLRGAVSQPADYVGSGSFPEHMRRLIGRGSDVAGATFEGGLERQDLADLVKDLSDEKAKKLREKLTPHIDRPTSHQLTHHRGAITGSYTEKEAEQWIAKYEEAMSEIPEDDS